MYVDLEECSAILSVLPNPIDTCSPLTEPPASHEPPAVPTLCVCTTTKAASEFNYSETSVKTSNKPPPSTLLYKLETMSPEEHPSGDAILLSETAPTVTIFSTTKSESELQYYQTSLKTASQQPASTSCQPVTTSIHSVTSKSGRRDYMQDLRSEEQAAQPRPGTVTMVS